MTDTSSTATSDAPLTSDPAGVLAAFLDERTPALGAIHALIHDEMPVLPEIAALLLRRAQLGDPFEAVWVVVPPRSNEGELRDRVAAAGTANEPAAEMLARLVTRAPADSSLEALLDLLEDVPAQTAVIVEHAELYHVLEGDGLPARENAPGPLGVAMGLQFEADVWVPSVCALVDALRTRPWAQRVHVLALVGKRPPTSAEHLEALDRSIDNYLMFTITGRPDEATLAPQIAVWRQVLQEQGIDELREQIAKYSTDRLFRAQVLARCLILSGGWEEAYRELEPVLDELRAGPPALLHQLSYVALYSGRLDLARSLLLQLGAAVRVDENTLRNAHKVALQANDEVAQAALLARMRLDYSRSLYLLRAELIERYLAKDFPAVVELGARLTGDPDLPLYRHAIERATYRCAHGTMRPEALIERIHADAPDRLEDVLAELAEDAIAERRFADALVLLRSSRPDAPHVRACALAGCALLRALALDPSTGTAQSAATLDFVLRYISDHAEDIDVRAELTRTLSVDHMGAAGLKMLLDRLDAEAIHPSLPPTPRPRDNQFPATTNETFHAFLAFLTRHYIEGGPKMINVRPELLRIHLSDDELRSLLAATVPVMSFAAGSIADEHTVLMPQIVAKAILDLGHTAAARGIVIPETLPIEIWAAIGQGMANAGMFQRARDFADLLLTYAGSHASGEAKRCGWIAHADVQLRAGRVEAAILGLLCARAQPIPTLHPSERYNELDLVIRLLRTLHLYEPALARIPALRATVADVAARDGLTRKIDDLETGLRWMRLNQECDGDHLSPAQSAELRALIAAACRSTEFALESNAEILVPASLLAQLLRTCEPLDVDVLAARELFERALADLPAAQRDRLRSLASATVDVAALLRLARAASQTRDAADLGAHLDSVRHEAARLLAHPGVPENALLAIELLADPSLESGRPTDRSPDARRRHTIQQQLQRGYHFLSHGPGAAAGTSLAMPESVIQGANVDARYPIGNTIADPDRLRRFACELGAGDREVVALALLDGRLLHVDVREGRLDGPRTEDLPRLSGRPLQRWRAALLQALAGADDTEPAGVADTEAAMHGLGITAPPVGDRTVVFLLTHHLAGVPANLLLRNGELSGILGPVVVVPSLSWLLERRGHPPCATGRRAWILPPGPDEDGNRGPLHLLADNLPEHLPGFITTIAFPALDQPLEFALLAAHGGIDDSGLYFGAVADEGVQAFSIPRVAQALAGCELVVLFVCNGGRHDTAPFSARSVGLPSALLAAGCRTVIASPWPLDALVALRWVSLFLNAWTTETDVAVAAYQANLQLMTHYYHPRDFLAMHVFGEPGLRPHQ